MKKIDEIVKSLAFDDFAFDDSQDKYDQKAETIVNEIFLTMAAISPAYKQAWGKQELYDRAKREWKKAIVEANLYDHKRIRLGMRWLRQSISPFIPSPGQFIQACKPSYKALGLPSPDDAFAIALKFNSLYEKNKPKIHDVINHTIVQTGSFELRTLATEKIKPIFCKNYENAIVDYLNGEFKPIPKSIELDDKNEQKKKDYIVMDQYKNIRTPSSGFEQLMYILNRGDT